ncbi:hypothetical protein [Phyllobacterium sp. OV277]|uniref:hypothetical protein n=1 Tax=Phyllobacterium sp. OV277 TaxID=1882772 RepID=UPI00088D6C1D|nr:hypothetical protein [Phyllobacterium sp. OV277]SDP89225.1 hypothetical protein SAMN05443582_11543 [Phyllobacterium sp. OV277]
MNNDPNKSPFVSEWTNAIDRERYVFHAREIYESNRYMERASLQAHLDYAKWILASLLAVHGGSIYALSTLRDKFIERPDALEFLASAAAMNVAGIVCTILTAGFAWLNFQALEISYSQKANPAVVYRTDRFDPPISKTNPVMATYYLAIFFAVLSLYCFIASACDTFKAIHLN